MWVKFFTALLKPVVTYRQVYLELFGREPDHETFFLGVFIGVVSFIVVCFVVVCFVASLVACGVTGACV